MFDVSTTIKTKRMARTMSKKLGEVYSGHPTFIYFVHISTVKLSTDVIITDLLIDREIRLIRNKL